MFGFRSELNRYNENTASALFGADLGVYLTALVLIFCLLSLVPVIAALMWGYKGVWRLVLRNAVGPAVAIAARMAIGIDPTLIDAGLIVLLLAIVGGLLSIIMSLLDVATSTTFDKA